MRRLPVMAVSLVLLIAPVAGASPYVIHGRGYGHGIGLSQWGAYGFAKHRRDHGGILGHYYRGAQPSTAGHRAVRVPLPSGRPTISFPRAAAARSPQPHA